MKWAHGRRRWQAAQTWLTWHGILSGLILVALIVSLVSATAGAAIGQEPATVDSDFRSRLVNPEVIQLGYGGTTSKLRAGQDYIIRLPAGVKTGYTELNGGRNILIDGGTIVMDGSSPSHLERRAIYIKNATGTVRIQNVNIAGSHSAAEFDAVAISAPEAVVELVNLTVQNLHGSYAGFHGDIVQPFGGVKKLVINGLTGRTSYQGFYLAQTNGTIGSVELRNVSLSYHPNPNQYSSVLLWFDSCSTYPVTLENVFIQPRSGQTMRASVRPDESGCKPIDSGSTLSWPAGSTISGVIQRGTAANVPELPDLPEIADTGPSNVRLKAPKQARAGARVKLTAQVHDPDGVADVAFAVCKGQRCAWGSANKLGTASGRPYSKVWKAPKRGNFTVLVRVTDGKGNVTVKTVKRIRVKAKGKSTTAKKARAKQQATARPERKDKRR